MGFFRRLWAMITGNLEHVVSKAEEPERVIDQALKSMGRRLTLAKQQVAKAIADEKRLRAQFQREQAKADEWEQRAILAVRSRDDGLASRALMRKKEHDELSTQLEVQWQKQLDATRRLKSALKALSEKIEEAKRKRHVLIAKKRRAEAMRSIQETMNGITDTSAFDTFDRMVDRIDQIEAEAEASVELSEEYAGDMLKHDFRELTARAGADQALDDLKRSLGMAVASDTARSSVGTKAPALESNNLGNEVLDLPEPEFETAMSEPVAVAS